MQTEKGPTADQLGRYIVLGAFFGMVAVGQALWFDIYSIASTLKTADNHLAVTLTLGGAMIGGGLIGATIGIVRDREHRKRATLRDEKAPAHPVATDQS